MLLTPLLFSVYRNVISNGDDNMTSTTAAHYAIFDRYVGLLQFLCTAENERDALGKFHADVGIDPQGEGLDAIFDRGDWDIREVTAEQVAALEAWAGAGSPADSFPL